MFGYMLSCLELNEKIDNTLMSVEWIWIHHQQQVSLALHKKLCPKVTKSNYQHL